LRIQVPEALCRGALASCENGAPFERIDPNGKITEVGFLEPLGGATSGHRTGLQAFRAAIQACVIPTIYGRRRARLRPRRVPTPPNATTAALLRDFSAR